MCQRGKDTGFELQGPRCHQIDGPRELGRQRECDSNIDAAAGQSSLPGGAREEGPLLFSRFHQGHLEVRPGRGQHDSWKPGARAEIESHPRARRKEGALPFIFIDEAESVLGTRRASRSFNISSTLVPMFCSEMDGIESLQDVVIILASNRPDLIDPAVLRPGRIDRKIKVSRPNRDSAAAILNVYLTDDLPLDRQWIDQHGGDRKKACADLVEHALSAIFSRLDENRLLSIRLRNGQNKVLYRSDLISGAILASIVQRAKERAIDRMIAAGGGEQGGMTLDDLVNSVHAEFREGEMLPPDDAAEEWLKLLDHHPEQVVGISSFRRGRQTEERLINQII